MIEKKDVEHVANLARLKLDDKETERFTAQLGVILEHVDTISEIDTSKIKPTAHAVDLGNVLREDKVDHEVSKEDALANAPDKEDGTFKVPRII